MSRGMSTSGSAPDPAGQAPAPVPPGYKLISEGSARMIYAGSHDVFYNRVQVLNRDLSVTVIREFVERNAGGRLRREAKKRLYKERRELWEGGLDSETVGWGDAGSSLAFGSSSDASNAFGSEASSAADCGGSSCGSSCGGD